MSGPNIRTRQRGVALISSLLLLLVATLMALSMFRSFGIQERIAGNTREKQRALNAAISAQQYAEFWLSSKPPAVGLPCAAGFINSNIGEICSPSPIDFTALPWPGGVTFTPFASYSIKGATNTVSLTGGQLTGQIGTYYQSPTFYITDRGVYTLPSGTVGRLYQVNALGYGGTADAVAVVESSYFVANGGGNSGNQDLSGP